MSIRPGEKSIRVCEPFRLGRTFLTVLIDRENEIHESIKAKIPCEKDGRGKYVFFQHRRPCVERLTLPSIVDGAAATPAPKRPNVQMPDEYLPPNKILFLQNLPESVTKDQLMALFSQLRRVLPFLAMELNV